MEVHQWSSSYIFQLGFAYDSCRIDVGALKLLAYQYDGINNLQHEWHEMGGLRFLATSLLPFLSLSPPSESGISFQHYIFQLQSHI